MLGLVASVSRHLFSFICTYLLSIFYWAAEAFLSDLEKSLNTVTIISSYISKKYFFPKCHFSFFLFFSLFFLILILVIQKFFVSMKSDLPTFFFIDFFVSHIRQAFLIPRVKTFFYFSTNVSIIFFNLDLYLKCVCKIYFTPLHQNEHELLALSAEYSTSFWGILGVHFHHTPTALTRTLLLFAVPQPLLCPLMLQSCQPQAHLGNPRPAVWIRAAPFTGCLGPQCPPGLHGSWSR